MTNDSQREEQIFSEAIEIPDLERRRRFLDEACGADGELRRRIERLIEAEEAGQDLFARVDEAEKLGFSSHFTGEQVGDQIGRYKLLEQIGEGGFGLVFMAEQTEPVRRKVALKIIKLGMDTKQVIARFEAERQALALMDHRHIARVFDGGATETGRPYFVMDLVRGIPITEYCDKQKLTTRERLELFIPVCQAVQHAHQKGIIHRDLKPSNVMVTLSDGVPHPMVIDFGVAKAINQKLTEQTLFTNLGQMIGTPAYMAPEQAEMSRLDVDTRSDIYSLGVLLYELLTGTQPFPEEQLRSTSWAEMQRIIAEKEPPTPSRRLSTLTDEQRTDLSKRHQESPAHLTGLLRGDLDWIVMKCLEKDRNRRYETANGLAMDIRRHLANEPVSAAAPTFSYRAGRFVRKHQTSLSVSMAFVLVLITATVVSINMAHRATVAQRHEEDRRKESDRRLYFSLMDQIRALLIHKQFGFRSSIEALLGDAAALDTDVRNVIEMRSLAMELFLTPYSEEPEPVAARAGRLNEVAARNPAHDLWAVSSVGKPIEIADYFTWEIYATLRFDGPPVHDLGFSWDGNTLVSAHQNGTIIIWRRDDSGNWSFNHEVPSEIGDAPFDIEVGTSGFVAMVPGSSRIYVWKNFSDTEPEIQQLPGACRFRMKKKLENGSEERALSPDDQWIAIRTIDAQKVVVWNLKDKKMGKLLDAGGWSDVTISKSWLEFSPDGEFLAWARPGYMQVFDTDSFSIYFEKIESSLQSSGFNRFFDFSPDGSQIVYGSNPGYVRSLKPNAPLATLTRPGMFAFGRTIPGLHRKGDVVEGLSFERWPVVSREFIQLKSRQRIEGLGFVPDEPLAFTHVNGAHRFWNLEDGAEVRPDATALERLNRLVLRDHRFHIHELTTGPDHLLRIVDEQSGATYEYPLDGSVERVTLNEHSMRIAASGKNAIVAWDAGSLKDGDPDQGKWKVLLDRHDSRMGRIARHFFSKSGRYLAWFEPGPDNLVGSGILGGHVRIYDIQESLELPHRIPAYNMWGAFQFLDDESQMAVAGLNGGIEIWDFVNGKRLYKMEGSELPFSSVRISNDGKYLTALVAGAVHRFALFDVEKRSLLFVSPNFASQPWERTWSKGNTHLGIEFADGRVVILKMPAIRSQLAELGLDW